MSSPLQLSVEEQPIDPDIGRFAAAVLAGGAEGVLADLDARRAAAERAREAWTQGGPVMQRTLDLVTGTEVAPVGVRLLDPPGGSGLKPALVYLHGGGFTLFSLRTHDRVMREYAGRSGAIVLGVDYALSPEAKFPIALQQIVAVLDWLTREGRALGVDPERIAVGGDSAGANLALAAALLLRDRGAGAQIKALLLNYGFFDADFSTDSHARHGGPGKLLTSEELAWYLENYLGGTEHWTNPLALPALAELHALPPSLHVIAECDPLADADRALADRLERAGNAVTCRVYRGATHSFLEAVSIAPLADRALAESAAWLQHILSAVEPPEAA